jgi:peptide/nickel transport system substrate-binding protein
MGRIRLQVIIALLTMLLLVGVMGYVAFNVTTVLVPDQGGTYAEGIPGNPRTINPVLAQANPVDQDLVALIFNGLTRIDEHGEVAPDLAEHWEISQGGLVYTFFLRDDVLWHDGATLTAADVVFTVHVMQSPDFKGAPFLSDMWRSVVVEQVDSYTVRFILRLPFAPFLDYTTIGILPQHILGGTPVAELGKSPYNASPIGTGPFRMEEVSALRIVLVANPSYYGAPSFLERLELYFYPDAPSVFEARQRGEVDGIARVLPQHLQSVRRDETLTLYSAPLSGYNIVFLNLDRAIFQDRNVRQAMMWALDRQKLVDKVLDGQGIVIHSPVLPTSWAYDPNVKRYQHDPRKARALLEEAGWFDENGDGVRERGSLKLEFTLSTNADDATRVQLIEAISEQLAEVGIRAVSQTVTWDELVGQQLRLRRFDAVLTGWQNLPPDPDPYPFWHSSQANEDGLNFASLISGEADALLAEARSTDDRKRRFELYQHFQYFFAEEVPSLLLYQPVYNYAVDASVQDVQIGPMHDSSDRFRTITHWHKVTRRMLYSEAREQGLTAP